MILTRSFDACFGRYMLVVYSPGRCIKNRPAKVSKMVVDNVTPHFLKNKNMKVRLSRLQLKCLDKQNSYAICRNMLFSIHIDVCKSCLGPS